MVIVWWTMVGIVDYKFLYNLIASPHLAEVKLVLEFGHPKMDLLIPLLILYFEFFVYRSRKDIKYKTKGDVGR